MIKEYTSKKDFEKIKDTTLNIEKNILNNYHSHNDFKRLIDTIVLYSDYSFFNTLLIDYQYPFFLDLGTENKFKKNGFTILNNAKKINILSPDNDVFVKVKNNDKEEILPYTSLTDKEKEKLNNPNDKSITLDHTELKGMNIIELYDCKDTTMEQKDYKSLELPALLLFDYQDIYNSFVKALYADGYKINYCNNLKNKFDYDKDNKTINLKKGINDRIKVLSMLDIYTSDNANNDFEKELLKYSICKGIGIDTDFDDRFDLYNWYKKTDFNDVEKSFKLISSKGRKFINNFNKFFSIEKKNFEYIPTGLYEDYNLSL